MKKNKLTIGRKILAGFLILVILFIANASIVLYTLSKSESTVQQASEVRTSLERTKEFKLLVTRSKMLITNWVYLQGNEEDKSALRKLQAVEYKDIREKIEEIKINWTDSTKLKMDIVLSKFDSVIVEEKQIMADLEVFEDYEDFFKKFRASDAIETRILPATKEIIFLLDDIANTQKKDDELAKASLLDAFDDLNFITLTLGIVMSLAGVLIAIFLSRSITTPVKFIKEIVVSLSQGELVEDKGIKFGKDEIGEMAVATENLVSGLKSTTNFAENIGKGNYETEYTPLSEADVLGNALIEMRNNLQNVAEEDKKRNWATEGVAKFGEILRNNSNSIDELTDEIVRNLVKYLTANQGGLYIIDDKKDEGEEYLTLLACYAWDKQKFLDQKIYKGEGLVGQSWQEMDTIYITDVPNNYVNITSGLGDANPTSVLIVPLKVNDEIYGIVELASFEDFKPYEIEFVEKIGESIASTISNTKINSKTQVLLEESQQMTEQMRAQEEEMRQNMEELQATQEEMQRSQRESQGTLVAVNAAFLKVDMNEEGVIMSVNDKILSLTGYERDRVIGNHYRFLASEMDNYNEKYGPVWTAVGNGQTVESTFGIKTRTGNVVEIKGSFSPMMSSSGEIEKIVLLAVDFG